MNKCIGYGEHELKCQNQAEEGSYWCDRCDKIRVATITKQFEGILKKFDTRKEREG